MSKIKVSLLFGVNAVGASACSNMQHKENQSNQPDVLSSHIDTTINPANDFFDYANGRWLKNNPIPDDQKSWGIASLVQEDLYKRLKTINEDAATKPNGAISQKIASFWKSGMDTASIDKNGINPIKPELAMIDNIKTKEDVLKVVAALKKEGVDAMFQSNVAQDDMNSDKMAFILSQGGLGLPNRDYYFNTDERTTKIREAYPVHIEKMFTLSGLASASDAKAISGNLMQLETALAKASRKLEDLRDPYKNYHKYAIGDLKKLAADIDWNTWLSLMNVKGEDSVIVGQPEFYTAMNGILNTESVDVLKNYLKWCLLNTTASYLSSDIEKENFSFY